MAPENDKRVKYLRGNCEECTDTPVDGTNLLKSMRQIDGHKISLVSCLLCFAKDVPRLISPDLLRVHPPFHTSTTVKK